MEASTPPRLPTELDVQLEIVHVVRLRLSGSSAYALAALGLILVLLMLSVLPGAYDQTVRRIRCGVNAMAESCCASLR